MSRRTSRHGYAMLLVLMFIALVLLMYGLSYRYVAAALRVETATEFQRQRDQGSVLALAQGLALLETGLPFEDPYVCGVVIDTSVGKRSFTVTYSSDTADIWLVRAAPTAPYEDPEPMPESFAKPDQPTDPQPGDKPKKPKKPKKEKTLKDNKGQSKKSTGKGPQKDQTAGKKNGAKNNKGQSTKSGGKGQTR